MKWSDLFTFYRHVHKNYSKPYISLIIDNIYSVFQYNISILEYFQFRFFEKSHNDRSLWAGTGFMYETILKLNPRRSRNILNDKLLFYRTYRKFINHRCLSIDEIIANSNLAQEILTENERIVIKNSTGQCGIGVDILDTYQLDVHSLIIQMKRTGSNLVEEFVQQHDDLVALAPKGLNTLRVITQLNKKNEVDILGVRLRISIDSHVDNLAAGNIAAPVSLESGRVVGPGVYSDITKPSVEYHPLTRKRIIGFQVPYFKEAIKLAKEAALHNTLNTSIGWDLAITNSGVDIIEGNHDWCKLVWQLPVQKGLKSKLSRYIADIKI